MKIDSARIETFLALCILLTTAVLFGKYYQPQAEAQLPAIESAIDADDEARAK